MSKQAATEISDAQHRCAWCAASPLLKFYHDHEWGFPVDNDVALFEKVCLEGFQAGLSWRTILAKREAFRAAFADFDFYRVNRFTEQKVEELLANTEIVRHRGKIQAVINNSGRAIEMVQNYGSLAAFFWRYEPDPTQFKQPQMLTTCPEAMALSRDLKKLGWAFVGPTTMFAFMQAIGMVNDHEYGCISREAVTEARSAFIRPVLG